MTESIASDVLGSTARIVWECLALSLAYGVLTMALIQSYKDLRGRQKFNAAEFEKWFPRDQADEQPIRPQMLQLATAGDEAALFGLSIDKMAGQINLAANSVIEYPQRYPKLLRKLAVGADGKDLETMIETDLTKLQTSAVEGTDRATQIAFADARTRVSHQVQRNIDSVQLSASQRWTRVNQQRSLTVSFLLGWLPVLFVALFPPQTNVFRIGAFIPLSIGLSIIGGFLAPILRDLASQATNQG